MQNWMVFLLSNKQVTYGGITYVYEKEFQNKFLNINLYHLKCEAILF